jgi:hypothetical protein
MKAALEPVLASAIEALETLGLRYAVVGGLAVSAWGAFRATRDVDLYVELPDSVRPAVRRELMARDFEVPAMDEELRRYGVPKVRSVKRSSIGASSRPWRAARSGRSAPRTSWF